MEALEWTAFDRIKHFDRHLKKIENSDFIRKSTRDALDIIRNSISDLKKDIEEAAIQEDKTYITQKATALNQKLFLFTNYLGILLRSTNTRNCFESYFSFSKIVEHLTGEKDLLIISSEWDAPPFYIPRPPEALKRFFFIGFPAFASRNALLLPLAAHEIGHAIWRLQEVEGGVYTTAELRLKEHLDAVSVSSMPSSLFSEIDKEELIGRCLELILMQAQEMFCDLFGAYLFKDSYSYAFEQYLSPGFGKRDAAYPSFQHRVDYIRRAAFENRDMPPMDSAALPSSLRSTSSEMVAVDEVVSQLHAPLCAVVKKILSDANLLSYSDEEEAAIIKCYQTGVPPQNASSAIVVLNAAWQAYRKIIESINTVRDRHAFTDFTNNLCMKSLEIIEYASSETIK